MKKWVLLGVLVLVPGVVSAQVNISVLQTYLGTSETTSHTTAAFTPSGTNRALVVCISTDSGANNPDVSSVAFNTSESLTKIVGTTPSNGHSSSLWWLANPSNVSATVAYTLTQAGNMTSTVMLVTNAAQALPTLTDTDLCTSPCAADAVSGSISTAVANTLVVTCAFSNASSHTHTQGGGQTELSELNNSNSPAFTESTSYINKVTPGAQAVSTSSNVGTDRMSYAVTGIPVFSAAVRRRVPVLFLN